MKVDSTFNICEWKRNQILTTSIAVDLQDFKLSDWNFDGHEDIFITIIAGNVAPSYWI